MRLLTLDPSGIFGYAFGEPLGEEIPYSGTFKLPDAVPSRKMVALERWIVATITTNGITDVIIEEPFLGARQSFQSVVALTGYVTIAGLAAAKCDCRCTTVAISTWRSDLGLPTQGPKNVLADPHYAAKFGSRKNGLKEAKRQYVKDRAVDFVRKLGSDPADDNEADAIAIFLWKRRKLAQKNEEEQKRDLFSEIEV